MSGVLLKIPPVSPDGAQSGVPDAYELVISDFQTFYLRAKCFHQQVLEEPREPALHAVYELVISYWTNAAHVDVAVAFAVDGAVVSFVFPSNHFR